MADPRIDRVEPAEVAEGMHIDIYGQHLGNVNRFYFYDSEKKGTYSAATASEVGDHVSGTVPSGLTVGPNQVQVTNKDGNQSSNFLPVQIDAP
ncbi:hypothetical protein ACFVUW_11015 [Streptomyces xiamenensis]|uniref:hypothetical protein n=1 Tax=Streptomyces xiamenensis TaxID=408015 RepID=UPI0036E5F313